MDDPLTFEEFAEGQEIELTYEQYLESLDGEPRITLEEHRKATEPQITAEEYLKSLLPPVIPGPKGTQGPQGKDGPIGPVGPVGGRGEAGAAGKDGREGPIGPVGQRGLRGIKGDKGEAGDRGPKGDTGNRGPQGDQGDIGPRGAVGIPGYPGLDGKAGIQGIHGEKGDKGDKGGQGDTGATGESAQATAIGFGPDEAAPGNHWHHMPESRHARNHHGGGKDPLYSMHEYVFVPDAAPQAVITAGNQQGLVLHSGYWDEIPDRLLVDAETAPGASGLPITVQYGDTNSLDTVAAWTTIAAYTLSSVMSGYYDIPDIGLIKPSIPKNRLIRMNIGTIVGSPADATITLRVWRPLGLRSNI